MSVGTQLGLDENSELLDQARQRWPAWKAADPRLEVVATFDDLRVWLPTAGREKTDDVLVALAMLAAPDGGDEIAAAGALAKCLLPGACRLAAWLSAIPPRELFHDNQPVEAGRWGASERVDELVASQLWIEVRTFNWRRLRKVAANILQDTRAGVLREVGNVIQVSRADRAWANTSLVDPTVDATLASTMRSSVAMPDPFGSTSVDPVRRGAPAADLHADRDEQSKTAEELLELLEWACVHDVISTADRQLLLCLVEEADRVETRSLRRGYGGLLSNEVSSRVAPRLGVSEATVRRHGSRSVRALAAAAPRKFDHDAQAG